MEQATLRRELHGFTAKDKVSTEKACTRNTVRVYTAMINEESTPKVEKASECVREPAVAAQQLLSNPRKR